MDEITQDEKQLAATIPESQVIPSLPSPAQTTLEAPQAVPTSSDEPSLFDQMKFVRDEIRFEHAVLGNRISAYLASQAFLMTAFAISSRFEHRTYVDILFFSFFGIPILGLYITSYIIPAVEETISRLGTQRSKIYTRGLPLYEITERLRPELDNSKHNMSLKYAQKLPLAFGVAWIVILLWGSGLIVGHIDTMLQNPYKMPAETVVPLNNPNNPMGLSRRSTAS